MIHGYHLILPHYGTWLPNDPRGSWTDFVAKWEITQYGRTTRKLAQRSLPQLSQTELGQRDAAQAALKYPKIQLDGKQALSVAVGFASKARKSDYLIWACSILPEHTHLVLSRHTYKVEQIANLLKGAATKNIVESGLHPLARFAEGEKRPPSMWARRQWKVYLDSDAAIENAINYVIENPIKEGKPRQVWSWLKPYHGLDPGWTTYH